MSVYIYNLHSALLSCAGTLLLVFLYLKCLSWGKEVKKREGKHFFVACVMIVKWHIASLQFLDARVWDGWYFPHEKYYWLQLKKHSRLSLPDSASLHGCGYGHGFVDVVGEYSRSQTVICVVGSFYHFLDSFELHDLLDRAKNLETDENIKVFNICSLVHLLYSYTLDLYITGHI